MTFLCRYFVQAFLFLYSFFFFFCFIFIFLVYFFFGFFFLSHLFYDLHITVPYFLNVLCRVRFYTICCQIYGKKCIYGFFLVSPDPFNIYRVFFLHRHLYECGLFHLQQSSCVLSIFIKKIVQLYCLFISKERKCGFEMFKINLLSISKPICEW